MTQMNVSVPRGSFDPSPFGISYYTNEGVVVLLGGIVIKTVLVYKIS